MYNEISLVTGESGVSHNGIYRGKDLGTISNLNEYIAFRSAHGIDDKSYKDLYLGDYFKIQDGTYNVEWVVAHFDYYYNRGDVPSSRGVVLMPRTICGESKMKDTNDTTGAYIGTIPYTTACPAIASALSTVLGSYLLSNKLLLTNATNANIASMAGAGSTGASTGWAYYSSQCVLPNEVQIFGSTVCSSSLFDVGESCDKLALFNFVNHVEYYRTGFWLRSIASASAFVYIYYHSGVATELASASRAMRPLIYIG